MLCDASVREREALPNAGVDEPVLRVQHGGPEHGNAEHADAEHADTHDNDAEYGGPKHSHAHHSGPEHGHTKVGHPRWTIVYST